MFLRRWYLQRFVKTHAWNTVNTNEFKNYIFHGNKPQKAKTVIFTAFLRNDFSKNRFFLDNFPLLKLPKTKRGGTPPPPFHILNFKIFLLSQKHGNFWRSRRVRSVIFWWYLRCFLHVPEFFHKKCNIKNYQKTTKKHISSWCLAFLGSRPLPQTDPFQGPCLTVFAMFYAHRALFKKEPLFCLRGGSAACGTSPYS